MVTSEIFTHNINKHLHSPGPFGPLSMQGSSLNMCVVACFIMST